jgi:hypothetical protein
MRRMVRGGLAAAPPRNQRSNSGSLNVTRPFDEPRHAQWPCFKPEVVGELPRQEPIKQSHCVS